MTAADDFFPNDPQKNDRMPDAAYRLNGAELYRKDSFGIGKRNEEQSVSAEKEAGCVRIKNVGYN